MDIPDLLEATDLTHRGGTYTVGFTQRREVQLFREFIAANPNSELRYQRDNRQHLRGKVFNIKTGNTVRWTSMAGSSYIMLLIANLNKVFFRTYRMYAPSKWFSFVRTASAGRENSSTNCGPSSRISFTTTRRWCSGSGLATDLKIAVKRSAQKEIADLVLYQVNLSDTFMSFFLCYDHRFVPFDQNLL